MIDFSRIIPSPRITSRQKAIKQHQCVIIPQMHFVECTVNRFYESNSMIHRSVLVGSALLLATAALAASPIADRQAVMKSFGGATKPLAAMLKGEKPFSLDDVKKSLATYAEGNAKFVTLFPKGSEKGENTEASPKIWSDAAGFKAANEKFKTEVAAAQASIKDEASFKATIPALLKNCGACHKSYRVKD